MSWISCRGGPNMHVQSFEGFGSSFLADVSPRYTFQIMGLLLDVQAQVEVVKNVSHLVPACNGTLTM